jgi:SAM-dependent methyltransferase
MKRRLTTKKFWKNYWTNEKLDFLTKRKPYFADLLKKKIKKSGRKLRFVEIGGFPGIYSFYAVKRLNCSSTLLDYFIDNKILKKLAENRGMDLTDIDIIDKDVFKYQPKKKFDIVFSSGFIEHFEDPEKVIQKHIDLLKPKGLLLITIPNFLGLNGYLQKRYDRELYNQHNIETMKLAKINRILKKLSLPEYKIYYYGNSGVWFEDLSNRPIYLKLLVYFFYILRFPLQFLDINSKFLSPHIVIEARK